MHYHTSHRSKLGALILSFRLKLGINLSRPNHILHATIT